MPKFELTARYDLTQNGMHVDKGMRLYITIPMSGITPGSLFGSSRYKDALRQQFAVNGLNLPPNTTWLNLGC